MVDESFSVQLVMDDNVKVFQYLEEDFIYSG